MATPFTTKLASVARGLFDEFHTFNETQPKLRAKIREFWESLGLEFPGVGEPWSAVFVSFCVQSAGATEEEFAFSPQHSVFVRRAIANGVAGTGVFRGRRITEHAPAIGDIIQNNRAGNDFDFDFAATHGNYASHSAIVVERGQDANGRFALTIGGNEQNSIRTRKVRLDANDLIVQREPGSFICVIEDLK